MIDEALIKITVNTEEDSVEVEITNFPELPDCTHAEFEEDHPAFSMAQKIILAIKHSLKINRELKNGDEGDEK